MSKTETRKRVCKAFLTRKSAKAGAFRSDGTCLYSYNLPLAVWDRDGVIALPGLTERRSAATREHQTYARLVVNSPEYFDD